MRILFILPAIGKKNNKKYIGTWKMEPLTIATLKALTPNDIETIFYDDRIENINYDIQADIVAISVETYTSRRAYLIADKFRSKGLKVLMGGYHVKAVPEEAKEHADVLILGNAENVWNIVIEDLKNNNLKEKYIGKPEFSDKLPDRSIFKNKKYCIDKEKLLYIINYMKMIDCSEKSIYKMLKKRKLLDAGFLEKLNLI